MPKKRALITGITGQDGSYLAELLLAKGYEVHGLSRVGDGNAPAVLTNRVTFHTGDLADGSSLESLVDASRADEVYHLAAQTNVADSFSVPEYTADVTALGTLRLLEAVRKLTPRARFFYAATSEMFGRPERLPQDESAPLRPLTPYAVAKVFGFTLVQMVRTVHGLFACSGILFNHESPRRGRGFVTQKIAEAVAQIEAGRRNELRLGSIEMRRDWGFAGDYVEAMWEMLQAEAPDDFVIATGESHSVREFCEAAFAHAGLDYRNYVVCDPDLVRPVDIEETRGDASKAARGLGWRPSCGFGQLVGMMVDRQRERLEEET
jgi:GDPmannose 4,6-dehydratase